MVDAAGPAVKYIFPASGRPRAPGFPAQRCSAPQRSGPGASARPAIETLTRRPAAKTPAQRALMRSGPVRRSARRAPLPPEAVLHSQDTGRRRHSARHFKAAGRSVSEVLPAVQPVRRRCLLYGRSRVRGAASILVIVTSSVSRNSVMQDRHQGRRTTRALLAMTQNPAAFLHLQHTCMDASPPEDLACLPGPPRVCPAGPPVVPSRGG
jgi:hypothetical protein